MMFRQGLQSQTHSYYIYSIEMNCDVTTFAVYNAMKDKLIKELGEANEKWLWHGTSGPIVQTILKNGFDRRYSTTQAWGAGVYFAKHASYSFNGYARDEQVSSTETEKVMLFSRVLLGDPCQGRSQKQHPDMKGDGRMHNCMVDRLNDPNIVVLSDGSDNQVFCEFVIRMRLNLDRGSHPTLSR